MQINGTATESNAWAKLRGLMAVLALPPVRFADGVFRKRLIEVEIAEGTWAAVNAIAVEPERLVFWFGINGERVEYVFPRSHVPNWRIEPSPPQIFGDP